MVLRASYPVCLRDSYPFVKAVVEGHLSCLLRPLLKGFLSFFKGCFNGIPILALKADVKGFLSCLFKVVLKVFLSFVEGRFKGFLSFFVKAVVKGIPILF